MQALFGVVYGIKFWGKKYPTPIGYTAFTMAPIEALWWTKSGKIFDLARPQDWQWSVMLRVPEFVTPTFFGVVVSQLMKAKPDHQYQRVMLAHMNEGLSVQIMHIGPYAAEQTSVDKLYAFAKENNLEVIGKHHELYFGDPRRTAPDKLRTILRLAVKKVS
jgi:hypothetical protein